jgi:hypothetical protein
MITMQDILKHLQVHIPFDQLLQKHLDKILRERINPEIAFNCAILDGFKESDYASAATILREAGRSITFHGPFMDLRPGAIDARIRRVSLERFRQLFDIASSFRPRSIVFHPSYDEKYYVSSGRKWLENSIDTWSQLIPLAEKLDTRIALENVYEADPGYRASSMRSRPDASVSASTRGTSMPLRHPVSRPGSTGSVTGSSRSTSTITRAPSTSTCPWGRELSPSQGCLPSCERGSSPLF